MEYDFVKTFDTGLFEAKFNAEHEAMGRWLSEEVSNSIPKQKAVLEALRQCHIKPHAMQQILGEEWTLQLENREVQVLANHMFEERDEPEVEAEELDERLNVDKANAQCGCGLVDFEKLFVEWCKFTA